MLWIRSDSFASLLRTSKTANRRRVWFGATLTTVIVFAGIRLASSQETQDAYEFSRQAQQGLAISPVPVQVAKHPRLTYLGSYIVNAQGGCNECHTCPSYRSVNPYVVGGSGLGTGPTPVNAVNFLSGGTPFQSGAIISANLTPDSSGLPGGMTYQQFRSAMHDGQDAHNPSHVLQAMPWPIFRNYFENDFRAVYDYLLSIPTAPSGQGNCTGPGQTK